MKKICTKCKQEKDYALFGKSKLKKDGLNSWCLSCIKDYRDINKEKLKLKRIEYKKTERYKNIREIYFNKNRDKKRKYEIEYYDKNREIRQKKKRENYHNRKKQNNSIRNKRTKEEKEIQFAIRERVRSGFKRLLKSRAIQKRKTFFEYTGISIEKYIDHFKKHYPEQFSNINKKGLYHIDHIIPCAIYDFNNPEDIVKCWQPENLRIILASDNLKKLDKIDYNLIEKHNIYHLLPLTFRK